ncbi:unnamed protein product [Closterium sp. NIES-54]
MVAAKRVLRYLCSTSGLGLVLGGRSPVVLTGHADASWVDDLATQWSSQSYTFSLGSGSVSWRSTRSSSVLSSSCDAEIYVGAMAAQELRWLTYLLTDLGEPPRSPPVLYVDNKAMLALCREHRLEHRTKHIALRYFLARELQQRGQLRLAYVASQANTADIFTKALQPCDHQRFCTMLVGADDDVQDAEDGWRTEADTDAATEAGTAEDVLPEGAPGGDDDDGVEYWSRDGLPEKLPIPTYPPRNRKRPHPSSQNRDSRPPSPRHKPNDHKRQACTAAEKLKWVAQLDLAVSVRALARESGIHRKCLANWKRAAEFLKEAHSARCRMHGRGRASWYRPMEIKVYERLLDWRRKGTAVSVGRLQEWSRDNALDGSEDCLAMAHRRSQLTAEVDVDDSIIADGFFGNNCQEPESDEEE